MIKKLVKKTIRPGRHPRLIRWGLYRGIQLHLDLHCELQNYVGLYECETFDAIRRMSAGCKSFLDLGAAKGELSIFFLKQPGIEKIVAVEPSESELQLLAANLELNGLQDDGRLEIHRGFAGQGDGPKWRTLDDLAADLPSPIFMKIDIDGPEAEVLATGPEVLQTKDVRLLIETHSLEAENGCIDALENFGYQTQILHPGRWRVLLPEHRPIEHNRWLESSRPRS